MADPQAARVPDRPGDPRGRAPDTSAEDRNADDGRVADSDGGTGADVVVGRSDECLRLDCGADDGRLRRHRLRGRLPEDRAAIPSRPVAALQDGVSGAHRHRRRRRVAGAAARRSLQHAAGLPVLQAADPGSRLVVPDVRGVRARGRVERRESHRRSGRPGHQRVRDCRGGIYRAGLRDRPPGVRRVPAAGALSAGRRADGVLRRAGRRVAGIPLVQLVPRRDFHGRHRVARARCRARHCRDSHQAGAAAADRRRDLRARSALGGPAGRVFQSDRRSTPLPYGAAASPLRAERMERAESDHALRHRRDHFCVVQATLKLR